MPHLKLHNAFITHKPKETDADCADAWKVSGDNRRVAVSDGVTRSLYPGIFAKKLVYRFCCKSAEVLPDCEAWLAPVRARWLEDAEERVDELRQTRNPAFINNRERLQTRTPGAATFVGVEFVPDAGESGTAKITIVGDSCLFIFVDGDFLEAFPCASSAEFDNQPKAFLSYAGANSDEPVFVERDMLPQGAKGAHFVLATDALAKWIFEQHEKGENPLPALLALKTESDFLAFVDAERERDAQALNDDVTLVIMQVGEARVADVAAPPRRAVSYTPTQTSADETQKAKIGALPRKPENERHAAAVGHCVATPALPQRQSPVDSTAFDATIIAFQFAFLCFVLFVFHFIDLMRIGVRFSRLDIFNVYFGAGFCGLSCILLAWQAVVLKKKSKRTKRRKGSY